MNVFTLITTISDFPKTWKKLILYLSPQERLIQWYVAVMMHAMCQMKARELLSPTNSLKCYEISYFSNGWPLNFGYLFLGTPCIYFTIFWKSVFCCVFLYKCYFKWQRAKNLVYYENKISEFMFIFSLFNKIIDISCMFIKYHKFFTKKQLFLHSLLSFM